MEKVAISSDHAGIELKASLLDEISKLGFEAVDLGPNSTDSVDYPDFADKVCKEVLAGNAKYGITICGSGIGMSIAANRHRGIRAALCTSALEARLSRQHNNANVLAMGARIIGVETARDCLKSFLTTAFEGGRHEKRIQKLG